MSSPITIKPAILERIVIFVTIISIFPPLSFGAERGETADLLKRITPPISVVEERPGAKDTMLFDSYYDSSDVIQGSRTGHWSELTNSFIYAHNNIHGYASFTEYERFDDRNYTANFGSYINFKDSYVHMEAGFGWDVTYIYEFQSITEYGHKITDGLFWQVGYNYRGYNTDDVHMVYPGLIYYFGDSYMSADYGASFMEGHDTAHFGTMRGSFAITKFLQWRPGFSFGQRLYDINGFDAAKEYGFILFSDFVFNLYKGINLRVGYSYGTERPKFIKRGLNFGLSIKF